MQVLRDGYGRAYGALTMLPPAKETFELFKQLYGVDFIIPENATFATAIGAGALQREGSVN